MTKSPTSRGYKIEAITVDDIRDTAMKCLEEAKRSGTPDLVVGVTPEWLFELANTLEGAGVSVIGDPITAEEENQLELFNDDEYESNLN